MRYVVKLGGAGLETPSLLDGCMRAIVELARDGNQVAVVHGLSLIHICVKALGAGFGFMPVTGKDRGPADQQFAVLGQLEFDIGERHAGRAHALFERGVEGDHRRGFGQAVTLPQGDAD